jgi:glycine/D-amino acid oxidase-like deaminating enzyme
VRQIERMVVGLELGARPLDAPSAEQPRRIVFDVSAPTWALLEEARQALTSETGGHVDDDALVNALARALLGGGGTRDEGRSAYQIALSVCDRCQTVTQRAGADDIVVDELVLDVAQ